MFERGIGLAELSTNEAETIVRGGKVWRLLQCTFVCIGCAGEIFCLFFRLAEQEQGVRRILFLFPLDATLLRGSRDAERASEDYARCTCRTADHARILACPERAVEHASRKGYTRISVSSSAVDTERSRKLNCPDAFTSRAASRNPVIAAR